MSYLGHIGNINESSIEIHGVRSKIHFFMILEVPTLITISLLTHVDFRRGHFRFFEVINLVVDEIKWKIRLYSYVRTLEPDMKLSSFTSVKLGRPNIILDFKVQMANPKTKTGSLNQIRLSQSVKSVNFNHASTEINNDIGNSSRLKLKHDIKIVRGSHSASW